MGAARGFRFGVNHVTTSLPEWQDAARKAEALGYATLIAQDHFGNQLAPFPSLVAAAAVTSRLRLATIVLDNDFRHPAATAKEAATVDLLTGGRLELGLGAGWLQADYDQTGIAYASPGQRVSRLEEAVQICHSFFTEPESVTFAGQYYRLEGLPASPRPLQRPRPPIMIGGRQRRMLSLAGRHADIVGISVLDRRAAGLPEPPSFAQKVAWVRAAAGERFPRLELHVNTSVVQVDADPEPAVRQVMARSGQTSAQVLESPATLVGSVDAIIDRLHALREQYGLSYWVIHGRAMESFARVIARL
ncbi:MAG TPA: TIGR03621 family F420-dependent LLM class oxidoreductase [Chloroflexota bacterium]